MTALPEPTDQLQQALKHHQAGQLLQAEAIYRQILAVHPKNFEALRLLGAVHAQRREFEVASRLIGDAIAIEPRHTQRCGREAFSVAAAVCRTPRRTQGRARLVGQPEFSTTIAPSGWRQARVRDRGSCLSQRKKAVRNIHKGTLASLRQIVNIKDKLMDFADTTAGVGGTRFHYHP